MGARLDVPTGPALGLGFRELPLTTSSVLTVFTSFVTSLRSLGFRGGKSPLADPEGIQGGGFAGFRVSGDWFVLLVFVLLGVLFEFEPPKLKPVFIKSA